MNNAVKGMIVNYKTTGMGLASFLTLFCQIIHDIVTSPTMPNEVNSQNILLVIVGIIGIVARDWNVSSETSLAK